MADDFKIHLLGMGSAKPTLRHNPACTVVEYHQNLFMVDCGEGAQQSMQRQRLRFGRLQHIFLTHLHGDHVFGLPGLIGTLALSGKEGELTIHTFADGAEMLGNIFGYFNRNNPFDIKFHILDPRQEETAFENHALRVRTIPLQHAIPAVGYIFEEKEKPRHIIRDMIDFHGVPVSQINNIKMGADFTRPDGRVIPNRMLTSDPTPSRTYAHISDTRYIADLGQRLRGTDVMFHETTYLDDHLADARQRFHSTARQAAMTARDAGASTLITGHYSSRYTDEEGFRREAAEVFAGKIILGNEGMTVSV